MLRIFTPKTKLVYGVRGSIYLRNDLRYKLYRKELTKADKIVCNSEYLQNELITIPNMAANKIQVIYNGVEFTDRKLKETVFNSSKVRIVVLANFHTYKGHDLFVEAVAKIDSPQLSITFVGSGIEQEKIIKQCIAIKQHEFHFAGEVQNVSEVLKKQDFAVHPSRTEGLSNAMLEEIAAGLPIICFGIGGNEEIITNEFNGMVIEPFEITELSKAIKELANNKNLRLTLAENALTRAQEFSWTNSINAHEKIFSTL